MAEENDKLVIPAVLSMDLESNKAIKKLETLITKIGTDFEKNGTIDVSKMLDKGGISRLRQLLQSAIAEAGDAGVDEAIQRLQGALFQIERKAQSLGETRLRKPDRKLVKRLAEDPEYAKTVQANKPLRSRAKVAVATADQITTTMREIAKVLKDQPELRNASIALRAAFDDLGNEVKAASGALNSVAQSKAAQREQKKLTAEQQKAATQQRRERAKQISRREIARVGRAANITTTEGVTKAKAYIDQRFDAAVVRQARLERRSAEGKLDEKGLQSLKRASEVVSTLSKARENITSLLQARQDDERAKKKRQEQEDEAYAQNERLKRQEAQADKQKAAQDAAEGRRLSAEERKRQAAERTKIEQDNRDLLAANIRDERRAKEEQRQFDRRTTENAKQVELDQKRLRAQEVLRTKVGGDGSLKKLSPQELAIVKDYYKARSDFYLKRANLADAAVRTAIEEGLPVDPQMKKRAEALRAVSDKAIAQYQAFEKLKGKEAEIVSALNQGRREEEKEQRARNAAEKAARQDAERIDRRDSQTREQGLKALDVAAKKRLASTKEADSLTRQALADQLRDQRERDKLFRDNASRLERDIGVEQKAKRVSDIIKSKLGTEEPDKFSAQELNTMRDYYKSRADLDLKRANRLDAEVRALGKGAPFELTEQAKAARRLADRSISLYEKFNSSKENQIQAVRDETQRTRDLAKVPAIEKRAAAAVPEAGRSAALLSQKRQEFETAKAIMADLSRDPQRYGQSAVNAAKDDVIRISKELDELARVLDTGTDRIKKALSDDLFKVLQERVAKQGSLTPGQLTKAQLKDRRDLLTEEKRRIQEAIDTVSKVTGQGSAQVESLRDTYRSLENQLRELSNTHELERASMRGTKSTVVDLGKEYEKLKEKRDKLSSSVSDKMQLASSTFAKQGLDPTDIASLDKIDFSKINTREEAELRSILRLRREQLRIERQIEETRLRMEGKDPVALRAAMGGGGGRGGSGGGVPPPPLPDADGLRKNAEEMDRNTAAMRRMSVASDALHSPLSQLTRLFNQFFRFAIGYGALYQVINFFGYLTRSVVDLNRELYSIQAIAGATSKEMEGLGSTIKTMAENSKFSLTETALAAKTLVQAGVEMKDLPAVLDSVTKFATAADASLEVAADLITTFRDVYGELDEATIANQLTKAVNISKLTAEDLKTIFSLSAQTAEGFNLTSEQYLSAVTTLRNAGIKASTVATGLRQAMLELFNPDDKTLKAFQRRYKQLGEDLSKTQIQERFFGFSKSDNPLVAAVGELQRLGFGGESQKTLQRVFDIRAVNALQALVSNFKELEASSARISFGEAAAEASEVQMRSLSNSVKQLGTAMTVFTATLTEGPIEALESLTDRATKAIKSLNDFDIAMRASGQQGIGGAWDSALVGGLTGATLGSRIGSVGGAVGSIGGAAVGGIAGTLVGIAGDLAKQKAEMEGETSVSSGLAAAGQVATALALLSTFLIGVGKQGTKIAKLSSAVGTLWSGAKAIFSWSWIGRLTTLAIAAYQLLDAFGLIEKIFPEDEVKRVRRQAKALQEKRLKQDQTRSELEKAAENLDVDEDTPAGSTADTLKKLQEARDKAEQASFDLFGNILTRNSDEFESLLQDYDSLNTKTRQGRQAALAKISPKLDQTLQTSDFGSVDFEISQILQLRDQYREGVKFLIQDTAKSLQKAQEIVLEATDEDSPEFKNALATLRAFQEVSAADPEISDIVFGFKEASADELNRILRELAEARARQLRGEIDNTVMDIAAEADAKVATAVDKGLQAAKKAGAIGQDVAPYVQAALAELTAGLTGLDEATANTIRAYNEAIQRKIAEIRRAPYTGPSAVEVRQQYYVVRSLENQVGANERRAQENKARQEEQRAGLQRQARERLSQIPDLLGSKDFETALNKSLDADQRSEVLRLANPADLEAYLNETSEYIETGSDGAQRFSTVMRDLLEFLKDVEAVALQTTEGNEITEDLERLDSTRESKARQLKLEARAKRIEKGSRGYVSTDYEELGIDGPANLYRQIAEEEKIQLQNELVPLERRLAKLSKEGGSSEESLKIQREKLDLQEKIDDKQARLNAIDLQTEEKILGIKENSERIQLQRLEKVQGLVKEKIADDLESGLEGLTIADAIQGLDTANSDLLAVYKEQLERMALSITNEGPDSDKQRSLYRQEIEARERQLRAILTNADELSRLSKLIGVGTDRLASALLNIPVSSGDPLLDVKIEKAGGVYSDAARMQKVKTDTLALTAQRDDVEKRRLELLKQAKIEGRRSEEVKKNLADQQEAANRLFEIEKRLAELRYEESQILATYGSEFREAFDLDVLAAKVRAMDSAMENLSNTLQDNFINSFDQLGDLLADAATGAGNLKQSLQELAHEWAKENVAAIIKGQMNNLLLWILEKFGKAPAPQQSAEAVQSQAALSQQNAANNQVAAANQQVAAANSMATSANQLATAAQQFSACACPAGSPEAAAADAVLTGEQGARPAIPPISAIPMPPETTKPPEDRLPESAQTDPVSKIVTGIESVFQTLGLDSLFQMLKNAIDGLGKGMGGLLQGLMGLFSGGGAGQGGKATAGGLFSMIGGAVGGPWGAALQFGGALLSEQKAAMGGMATGEKFVRGYRKGGVLKGPGSGTSDSLDGVMMGSDGKATPIAVSTGEAVITQRAVDLLGEDFIHQLNAGRLPTYNAREALNVSKQANRSAQPAPTLLQAPAAPAPKLELTTVNAIDSPSVLESALNSPVGGQKMFNFIRANKGRIKTVLA